MSRIQRTLAGQTEYDELTEREQAVVRAIWERRFAERRRRLDLAAEFTRAGRTWTESDEQGNAVARGIGSDTPDGN